MATNQQHDNLGDIPINSVLIGVFAETLKKLGHLNQGEYPEFVNIEVPGATKASNKTYKFKSIEVRKYLEELKHVIDIMLGNFVRGSDRISDREPSLKMQFQEGPAKLQKSKSVAKSQYVEEEPEMSSEHEESGEEAGETHESENTSEEAGETETTGAVAELEDEQPSTGADNEGVAVVSPMDNETSQDKPKIMTGGKHKKAPKRKLSLKKRKN